MTIADFLAQVHQQSEDLLHAIESSGELLYKGRVVSSSKDPECPRATVRWVRWHPLDVLFLCVTPEGLKVTLYAKNCTLIEEDK